MNAIGKIEFFYVRAGHTGSNPWKHHVLSEIKAESFSFILHHVSIRQNVRNLIRRDDLVTYPRIGLSTVTVVL
jgi:hypothetical protein